MKIAFCVAEDFNLGASYVISFLKSLGHEVRLFFDPIHPPNRFLLSIEEFNPDLVCFSCVTANVGWALQLARQIKKTIPVARTIFGGVHPTLCPEELRNEDCVDFVCEGDGIKYFGGEFDPDKLWPDREIFFEQLPKVHREYQIFLTGFGCPFRCSFCNNHQLHPKLTRRSVSGCINELMHLKKGGMRYALFDDDVFTINRIWLMEFLNAYRRRVGLPFTCFSHTRCIDTDISEQLKMSGCETVWLGVQSGDEETRREILNRHETNAEIIEASKIIKSSGLRLMVDHIFGLPKDNYQKLLNSYKLYRTIKPDVLNCYELLYFPKSDINKFGEPDEKAKYQKQGGRDYKKYARAFLSIPLLAN